MAKKGHRGGLPKGFTSKAQWRMFFASKTLNRWAHQEAHKTMARRGGPKIAYRSLPVHQKLGPHVKQKLR